MKEFVLRLLFDFTNYRTKIIIWMRIHLLLN